MSANINHKDEFLARSETTVSWLALLTTSGTLICCALPIMLVTLGMGASVAAMTSALPVLVTLSENKTWIFIISGGLILVSAWVLFRPGRSCPTDPALAALCTKSLRWNRRILFSSIVVWCIGFFAAYLLLPLRLWLENTGIHS